MLTPDTNEAVYGPDDNQGDALFPVDPKNRLVPLDPDVVTNMSDNEIKVAGPLSNGVGRAIGRAVKPFGSNTFGDAYTILQEKIARDAAEKERARVGPPPLEVAADALKPKQSATMMDPRKPFDGSVPPPVGQPVVPPVGTVQPPPSSSATKTTGLVGEMNAKDGYTRWLTLGDEELDTVIKGALKDPRIDDGMIAGIRVQSADGTTPLPGMETKVPDEGHIYNILQSSGDVVKSQLKNKSPDELKQISLQQTEQMANLLGVNPEKLKDQIFGGYARIGPSNPGELAARMVASKNLLVAEIRKLDELVDMAAEEGSDKARFAVKQQVELVTNLQRHFMGQKTDIARALSAMRIPVDGDMARVNADYAKMLDDMGGTDGIDAFIDGYRNLPDANQRLQFATKSSRVQRALDAVHEVWLNSLLSGWFTHVKNTAGVVAANVMEIAELAATATVQLRKPLMGEAREVEFGDVAAKIFGQMMSMREAFTAGGTAFIRREEPFQGAKMTLISGSGNPLKRADAFSSEALGNNSYKTFVDLMGHGLTLGRAPVRALMAEDAFAKVVAYRGSLYEQAYVSARQQGLKGEQLSEAIAEFVFNPPRDARDTALNTAKYITLQTDMEGALKGLQKFSGGRFMRLLVPFFKTPTNAFLWVAERSPFAKLAGMSRYKKAQEQGGRAAAIANTRMVMGTGIMALAYQQWEAGDFTGGLSADPSMRRAYARMGVKPYHVRINGKYYNYGMLEPFSTMIGLMADVNEVVNHPDTDDKNSLQIVGAAAATIAYNLTNKTFMSGIQSFLDASRNPGRFGARFIENYAKSIVPGSAAFNEMRKGLDEMQRFRRTLKDQYKNRLPGLSKDLEPALDLWGRPIPTGSRWSTPYKPNAVDEEIIRMGVNLSKHPTTVPNLDGELSEKETHWYHKRAGELARANLEALVTNSDKALDNEKLSEWFDPELSEEYAKLKKVSLAGDKLATDECAKLIKAVLLASRQQARGELLTTSEYAEGINEQIEKDMEKKRVEAEKLEGKIQ